MARVFTTSFQYNRKTYTAILTQSEEFVYIRIANDQLEDLVPLKGLKVPSRRLVALANHAETETDRLLSTILSALEVDGPLKDVLPPRHVEKVGSERRAFSVITD